METLSGTWFGVEEQGDGTLVQLQVVIDGDDIESVEIDGIDVGLTGEVDESDAHDNIYEFVLSDGTEGGFFLDDNAEYMVFLDEEFDFGVLQRGATGFPAFDEEDIWGRAYEGVTVIVNDDFEVDDVYASEVSVAMDGWFEGQDDAGYDFEGTSPLNISSANFGTWSAMFESTGPGGSSEGLVRVFSSPDKQFLGSWACAMGGAFPEDCSFTVWRAQ